MKQKLLSILLVLAILTTLSACVALGDGPAIQYKEINGEMHIVGYTDKTTVKDLVIPDEVDGKPVTVIEDFGLYNADSLNKITIGKNVRQIGTPDSGSDCCWALTNNQHLAAFEVAEGNMFFKAVDGVLFSADGKILYAYPCGRGIEFDDFGMAKKDEEGNAIFVNYEIPDGVEEIHANAFYKCYYVNITYFPDSIKVIEEKAFHRCSSLQIFSAPANLEHIGKDVFSYNENLKAVILEKNVCRIDDTAFFNCKNLKYVYLKGTESDMILGKNWQPTDQGRDVKDLKITFDAVSGEDSLIYYEEEIVKEEEKEGCKKKEKKKEYVLHVVGYIDKPGVTEIEIPDEIDGKPVVSIADYVFRRAENLNKITIGKNVKEVGIGAFFDCTNLTEIIFNAKKSDVSLKEKWQPTDKGKILKDLTVTFQEG